MDSVVDYIIRPLYPEEIHLLRDFLYEAIFIPEGVEPLPRDVVDLPELKQMISLLRYTSNNINQIAKRLNESGRAYDTDLAEILEKQKQLWGLANKIFMKLSAIQ